MKPNTLAIAQETGDRRGGGSALHRARRFSASIAGLLPRADVVVFAW